MVNGWERSRISGQRNNIYKGKGVMIKNSKYISNTEFKYKVAEPETL